MLSREQLEMELMYLLNGTGVGGNILAHDQAQRDQREQDRQRIEELERDKVGAAGQIMALVCKAAKERDALKQRLAAVEQELAQLKAIKPTDEIRDLLNAALREENEYGAYAAKKIIDQYSRLTVQLSTLTQALAQARGALETLQGDWHMEAVEENRSRAKVFKADGDMYGWNFYEGLALGHVGANITVHRLIKEALNVPAAGGGGDVCRVALERIWRMLNCSEESPFCDDRTHGNLKHHDCHIHEIRDTVLHALAAAPTPGLVWTTEPPTVPGWYWWRDCETREAEVCEVYTCQLDGRTVRVNWTTDCYTNGTELAEYDLGHWAGPLSLPKEA